MHRITSSSGQIRLNCLKKRTFEVLQAVRRSGLKLNRTKYQFNHRQLTLFGHTISNKGITPDARKIKAITDMSELTNQKELQCIIKNLGKFLPNFSTKAPSLRLLLVKDIISFFDKTQMEPLQELKKIITQSPTLKYFDPKLPIKVSSDVSAQESGALQEHPHENERHPIAYASRSLTLAETHYCLLELEIVSILFACQYLHEYIYRHFFVHNNHKPL